jgi:hypothetical protein
MVIPKKRYWFVFNEYDCQLEAYACENDYNGSKPPLNVIDIYGSATLFDVNEENQFYVL